MTVIACTEAACIGIFLVVFVATLLLITGAALAVRALARSVSRRLLDRRRP